MASGGDAQLITGGIITNREWANYPPDSIHAYQHQRQTHLLEEGCKIKAV